MDFASSEPEPEPWDTAGIVIYRVVDNGSRQYLLVRHKLAEWTPPKGLKECYETPIATAIRKVYEETNLRIIDYEILADGPKTAKYATTNEDLKKTVYYLARLKDKFVAISGRNSKGEIEEVAWFSAGGFKEKFDSSEKCVLIDGTVELINFAEQCMDIASSEPEPEPEPWDAAGIVIYRVVDDSSRQYLLVQNTRRNTLAEWTPPKGLKECYETPIATAIREVYEETNLRRIDCEILAVKPKLVPYNTPNGNLKKTFYYLARFRDTDVAISGRNSKGEIEKVAWFSADDSRKKMKFTQMSDLIAYAESSIGTEARVIDSSR